MFECCKEKFSSYILERNGPEMARITIGVLWYSHVLALDLYLEIPVEVAVKPSKCVKVFSVQVGSAVSSDFGISNWEADVGGWNWTSDLWSG